MTPFAVHPLRPLPGAPRVVLLHGVYADHHLWDPVVPLLEGLDVVALDSPGHGAAPAPDALPALHVQVDRLAALVERLPGAGAPPVLAGHSWGGMLALRLAAARPDLVGAVVLVNTPLRRNRGASRAGFRLQRLLLAAGLPPGVYGRVAATSLYGRAHRRAHPEVVAETGRTVAALGRRGTIGVVDRVLLEPGDATDLLARLTVPALLVAGEDDYVGSADVRERVSAAGHALRLHPGGHMGPREAPDEVARLVREAVAAVRGPVREPIPSIPPTTRRTVP